MQGKEKEPNALRPFLSLAMAARIVYAAKAEQRPPPDEETLNGLARMIAARTRVFARYGDGDDYALVMPSELAEGDLEGGGTMLTFPDGRTTLTHLAILHADLGKVVQDIGGGRPR